MKPSRLFILASVPLGIAAFWLVQLRADGTALSAKLAQQRSFAQEAAEARRAKIEKEKAESASLSSRLADLNSQLTAERQKTVELAAQKAEIESKLPPVHKDDLVVSFGRVRDMAAEMGEVARLVKKMEGHGAAKLTAEESQLMMSTMSKVVAWLPEISAFEDTPAEISTLQAGTIASVFALDAEAAARVEQVISDHFSQMKLAGLTASSKDRPGWRDQRSASIVQLMWKLRPLLPANPEATPSLPFILNLGAGMDKHVDLKIDAKGESKGTVTLSLPTWPRVPWEQRK